MKQSLQNLAITLVFLFASVQCNAQIFWTENFQTGGVGWNIASVQGFEDPDFNLFEISDAEGGGITPNLGAPNSCGVASNGNNSLFVTTSLGPGFGGAYLTGGFCVLAQICVTTNRQAETPTISCLGKSNITLAFNYIENGDGVIDNATLWYYNGTVWAQLDDMPKTLTGCTGQGLWTSRTVLLPASADNNANVKLAFRWVNNDDGIGTDPSFAVDDMSLNAGTSTASITTITNIPQVGKCACDSMGVYFTSTGIYTAGNVYTAQLSNATGSFASPTIIGSITSIANLGLIPTTIPCNTPAGTGYRVRVVSSTPSIIGSNNNANFIINTGVTPSVTISQSPASPICTGTPVTFTAVMVNGGTTPTYQWKKNGTNVGTNNTTYTSATLANGDIISCLANSNAPCATSSTATSNNITMVVSPMPMLSITTTPSNGNVCAGGAATICASGATNLSWTGGLVNCTSFIPTTNTTYTLTGSNANGCTATSTASIIVNAVPTINLAVTPSNTSCQNQAITCCVTGNGSFVWSGGIVNCVAFVPTATNVYTVTATNGNGTCTITSVTTITVANAPILAVTITPTSAVLCSGSQATLCATGASNYVWTGNITNCTGFGAISTTIYTVTGTSANGCTATATKLLTVNPSPVLTITATPNSAICADEIVNLCATGAASYSWTNNIINCANFAPSATATYTVTGNNPGGCSAFAVKTVVVQPNITPSVSIVCNPTAPYIGNSATFTATVMPTSITLYQISWYRGNALIANFNSPINTFTTTITNLTDSVYALLVPVGYCVNPDSIKSQKIGAIRADGLESINIFGASIYPNPTTDNYTINGLQAKDEIQLCDGVGKLLQMHIATTTKMNVDMQAYAMGIYFIKIKRGERLSVMKVGKVD